MCRDGGVALRLPHPRCLARYEIVEMVPGRLSASEIDIHIADHYGFPSFARYPHALSFVAVGRKLSYLHKYQGHVVYRTTSNAWASCSKSLDRKRYNDRNQPTAEVFLERFGPRKTFEMLSADGSFSVTNLVVESKKTRCLNSQPLSMIYEKMRSGVMTPPLASSLAGLVTLVSHRHRIAQWNSGCRRPRHKSRRCPCLSYLAPKMLETTFSQPFACTAASAPLFSAGAPNGHNLLHWPQVEGHSRRHGRRTHVWPAIRNTQGGDPMRRLSHAVILTAATDRGRGPLA